MAETDATQEDVSEADDSGVDGRALSDGVRKNSRIEMKGRRPGGGRRIAVRRGSIGDEDSEVLGGRSDRRGIGENRERETEEFSVGDD